MQSDLNIDNLVSEDTGVSVVIATLGTGSLDATLASLNSGTIPPLEILICIPEREAGNVKDIEIQNLRVIKTSCRGQVAQRAEGFKQAKHKYVLQMDDDVIVAKDMIERLLEVVKLNAGEVAVAPGYFIPGTNYSLHRQPEMTSWYKTYLWLINGSSGYNEGSITKSGLNFGVDTTTKDTKFTEVEWLPGGCVLHKNGSTVSDNFFPFSGKAYCEDIIHSFHLRLKHVRLLISTEAQCWTVLEAGSVSSSTLIKQKFDEFRKRKYYMNLAGRSSTRLYMFFIFHLLYSVYKRTFKPLR